MDNKHWTHDLFRALGLLTQLGVSMGVCILMCVLGGRWLDKKFDTSPSFLLLFSIIGAASAFKILYDLTIKEWGKKK